MTRKSINDPGRPPGIVLTAATSFWLPVLPKRLFDFLLNENSRNQWDILLNGGAAKEMVHIANGRDPGNCVSLLRSPYTSESNMQIIQKSCTDVTGSMVVYAPVDAIAMNLVMGGGDLGTVALLPSGFAILPDCLQRQGGGFADIECGGSLLTAAFQILVVSAPTEKFSVGLVATIKNLITFTVERIKGAVTNNA